MTVCQVLPFQCKMVPLSPIAQPSEAEIIDTDDSNSVVAGDRLVLRVVVVLLRNEDPALVDGLF